MAASTRSDRPALFSTWYDVTLRFGAGVRLGEVRLAGNDAFGLDLT